MPEYVSRKILQTVSILYFPTAKDILTDQSHDERLEQDFLY